MGNSLKVALQYTQRALTICLNSYGGDNPHTEIVAEKLEEIKQAMAASQAKPSK